MLERVDAFTLGEDTRQASLHALSMSAGLWAWAESSPNAKTESIPLAPWKVLAYLSFHQRDSVDRSFEVPRIIPIYLANAEDSRSRAKIMLKRDRHVLAGVQPEPIDREFMNEARHPIDEGLHHVGICLIEIHQGDAICGEPTASHQSLWLVVKWDLPVHLARMIPPINVAFRMIVARVLE